MKKLLTAVFIVMLFLFNACSDMGTNNPVDQDVVTAEKATNYEFIELGDLVADTEDATEYLHWTGMLIYGPWGGDVPMLRFYFSPNGIATVKANLDVPRNAFSGIKLIRYTVDDELAVVDFDPGMAFNKDLTFDLKFTNIDLGYLEANAEYDFAYLDNNGSIVLADYKKITVDVENGNLEVKGAKIGHFSRYGFVRAIE